MVANADSVLHSRPSAAAPAAADDQPTTTQAPIRLKRRHDSEFTLYNAGTVPFDWSGVVPYYLWVLYFVGLFVGYYVLHNNWVVVWMSFGLIPLLDIVLRTDTRNPARDDYAEHEDDLKFKLPLWLYLPVHMATVVWALNELVNSNSDSAWLADNLWQRAGLIGSVGILSGLGLNIGHELVHKRSYMERQMGGLLLMLTNYEHFAIEHVAGHHKWVATPEDPATALRGINFFSFYPRSLIGGWLSCWNIEAKRLREREGITNPLALGTLHRNSMVWFALRPLVFAAAVGHFYTGSVAATVGYFVAQAWIGHMLLEVVNYVEHYGLERKLLGVSPKTGEKIYETVDYTHSWNAPHSFSNFLLFKLQRHSDHHANATRRYHLLRTFEESPMLPTGYAGMVVMALVPPVFWAIMNPIVDQYAAAKKDAAKRKLLGDAITEQMSKPVFVFSVLVSAAITYLGFLF